MAQLLLPRKVRLRGIRQPVWPQVDETHPINRGLVGYWPCDGEGVLQLDYSGFGNNGVASNVSLRDNHHGGNALSYNGTNSDTVISSNAAILGANPRTLVAWVYQTNLSVINAIFSYGANNTSNLFDFLNDAGNPGGFYFSGNTNDVKTTSGGLVAANTWAQLAVVYNGGAISVSTSLQIYVNGVSAAMTLVGGSTGTALNTTSTAVHIGIDLNNAGRNLGGGIEGVRWYNRALTTTEIQQLYAEPYAGILDASASIIPTGAPPLPLMGQIWLA